MLIALACLLGGVILLEYRGVREPSPDAVASLPVAAEPRPARVPVHGVAASAAALEDAARIILDRPVFSPSRRPGVVAAPASTELPRLAGVIVGPDGARAIFAGADNSRAIVARAGGHAGPYLIRSVGLNGVSVIGPNGPQLLHPTYDHDPPRATAEGPAINGTPSILDLLRGRIQSGNGLRSVLLPPSTPQPPTPQPQSLQPPPQTGPPPTGRRQQR